MWALRLKSVSRPGRWSYVFIWNGTTVLRHLYPHLRFDTREKAEAVLNEIKSAWFEGRIVSKGLSDERINSIEIYRLPPDW